MLGDKFLVSLGQNLQELGFHFLLCEVAHVGISLSAGRCCWQTRAVSKGKEGTQGAKPCDKPEVCF